MSGIFLEYLKNVINGTGKDGNKCFESEQKDSEFFLESQIYGYKEKKMLEAMCLWRKIKYSDAELYNNENEYGIEDILHYGPADDNQLSNTKQQSSPNNR